jgi:SAM-dependent methyltransferase
MTCQACDSTSLTHILSLGPLPPCNDMRPIGEPAKAQEWLPTDLLYCPKCELVQLEYIGDPRVVFPASYPYTSGSTKLLRDNFADLARECYQLFDLGPNDLVVDIGSNDGTLLSNFKKSKVVGVEPTDVSKIAWKRSIETYDDFFDRDLAREIVRNHGQAKLITCTNCFAHMKDIHDVIEGILDLLAPDGVFVTESHYLIDLIDRLQYDTVYHEHLRYYSLTSLRNLLEQHGFYIFKTKKIPTHGGSIRVYARRADFAAHHSDAIDSTLSNEPTGKELFSKLLVFADDVVNSKLELLRELADLKRLGYSIWGISAPSRASTVVNYCRLDGLIDRVVEVEGSLKVGKYMPGTSIPVVTEGSLFGPTQPSHAILFSWHLADELIPKLKAKGYKGKFIMPCSRSEPSQALRQPELTKLSSLLSP